MGFITGGGFIEEFNQPIRPQGRIHTSAPSATGHIGGAATTEAATQIGANVTMGVAIKPVLAPLVSLIARVINYLAAVDIPSAPEVMEAFTHGPMTRTDYECLMRLNGADPQAFEPMLPLRRARPSDTELLILQRKLATYAVRATLPNPPQGTPPLEDIANYQQIITDLYRLNGWTDTGTWNVWQLAQQWVPSPTDAITWMLKDVADPAVVDTFALDAEFRQKYSGDVKDVFDWNGISENDGLNLWKSHWRNMAPGTLYELHKRLRPGWTILLTPDEITRMVQAICPVARPRTGFDPFANRPAPVGPQLDDLINAGVPLPIAQIAAKGFPVPTYCSELQTLELQQAWLESLGTTGFHVYEGLGQSDYAPFWRERLLAISYRVITRVDARRAYEIGKLSYERLIAVFQDQGNSPADAASLAAFIRFNAIQLNARRPIANSWVNSRYDTDLLKIALMRQGMREDMWPDVFSILSARRDIKVQQDCLKSIEKQYMVGLLTQAQVEDQLEALQVTGQDRFSIIKDWNCVKLSRSKAESAANVCLYLKTNLIDWPTAQKLITNLGYTNVQAKRILATCWIRKLPKTIDLSKLPQALNILGTLPE